MRRKDIKIKMSDNFPKQNQKLQEIKKTTDSKSAVSQPKQLYLRAEDRILWEAVVRTTRPLRPKISRKSAVIEDFHLWEIETGSHSSIEPVISSSSAAGHKNDDKNAKLSSTAVVSNKINQKKTTLNELHPFDRPTIKKISKGRLEIEARIDLHGLTQREAHDLLYGFLADAWNRGLRLVMVITGKGSSSRGEGVLKQVVPHWFSTPLFRIYVSSYENAARHHGGQGALYVRLRRSAADYSKVYRP